MNRSVAGVIVALILVLGAMGILLGENQEGAENTAAAESSSSGLSIERVARQVERIRELRFERLPRVRSVSAEEFGEDRGGDGDCEREECARPGGAWADPELA